VTRSQRAPELDALVTRLRHEDPDAVVRWAEAHETLLRAFIATCAGAAVNTTASTAASVAKEELQAWAAVRSGVQPFVRENTYYVQVDPNLHRTLFGECTPAPLAIAAAREYSVGRNGVSARGTVSATRPGARA
jgi:hypothetical protein